MWLRRGRLFGLGRRLSYLALTIQILVPFLVAIEIHATARAAESAAFEQSLCHHDGPAAPGQTPQQHECDFSCCLICRTLIATAAFVPPTHSGISNPLRVASVVPRLVDRPATAPPLFARPFRSRAPPSA